MDEKCLKSSVRHLQILCSLLHRAADAAALQAERMKVKSRPCSFSCFLQKAEKAVKRICYFSFVLMSGSCAEIYSTVFQRGLDILQPLHDTKVFRTSQSSCGKVERSVGKNCGRVWYGRKSGSPLWSVSLTAVSVWPESSHQAVSVDTQVYHTQKVECRRQWILDIY